MKAFYDGLITNNPTFRQLLGLCPTLAVTTTIINGLGMGLATTVVLIGSSVVISSLKSVIPAKVRIPAYIVIIACFVTVIDLFMNAYLHDLHKVLGLFIPLIVVNCIVLGRAESFASKNSIASSAMDALGNGFGFTLGLCSLAAIRELLGSGSLLGITIFGESVPRLVLFALPPGAFIALGFLLAGYNWLQNRKGA
ncbi:MAG: electron transport complex subunit E [Deferribacteraceae bacterium]|jgi:electron transport complex protein RnfE|nr:electron transport complex subunit E [Deferribacteraceae bacterium]